MVAEKNTLPLDTMNMYKVIFTISGLSSLVYPFLSFLYSPHKFNCTNACWCRYVFRLTIECNAVFLIWVVSIKVPSVSSIHIVPRVGGMSCVHFWTTYKACHLALHLTSHKQAICWVIMYVPHTNHLQQFFLRPIYLCHINYGDPFL